MKKKNTKKKKKILTIGELLEKANFRKQINEIGEILNKGTLILLKINVLSVSNSGVLILINDFDTIDKPKTLYDYDEIKNTVFIEEYNNIILNGIELYRAPEPNRVNVLNELKSNITYAELVHIQQNNSTLINVFNNADLDIKFFNFNEISDEDEAYLYGKYGSYEAYMISTLPISWLKGSIMFIPITHNSKHFDEDGEMDINTFYQSDIEE